MHRERIKKDIIVYSEVLTVHLQDDILLMIVTVPIHICSHSDPGHDISTSQQTYLCVSSTKAPFIATSIEPTHIPVFYSLVPFSQVDELLHHNYHRHPLKQ